jgi:hypothetical protein
MMNKFLQKIYEDDHLYEETIPLSCLLSYFETEYTSKKHLGDCCRRWYPSRCHATS